VDEHTNCLSREKLREYCQTKLANLLWELGYEAGAENDWKAAGRFLDFSGESPYEMFAESPLPETASYEEFEQTWGEWLRGNILPHMVVLLDEDTHPALAKCSKFINDCLCELIAETLEYAGEGDRKETDSGAAYECIVFLWQHLNQLAKQAYDPNWTAESFKYERGRWVSYTFLLSVPFVVSEENWEYRSARNEFSDLMVNNYSPLWCEKPTD
jgi:hypothetical protein